MQLDPVFVQDFDSGLFLEEPSIPEPKTEADFITNCFFDIQNWISIWWNEEFLVNLPVQEVSNSAHTL